MKKMNALARGFGIFMIFFMLLLQLLSSWAFSRFWLVDAQNRLLDPSFYDLQMITADDYKKLSDPANRKVTLSDGSTMEKGPTGAEFWLQHYKPTVDKKFYVLVTTKGTRHVLSYLEPLVVMGSIGCIFGLLASSWNLMRLRRELSSASGGGVAHHSRGDGGGSGLNP